MSTEIFAFVQAQVTTQPQPTQQIISQGSEDSQTQPGLFDSLITEITQNQLNLDFETLQQPGLINQQAVQQVLSFSDGNSFTMSMINLLPVNISPENPDSKELLKPSPENLSTDLKNLFATIKSSLNDNPIEQAEIFGVENFDEISNAINQLVEINDNEEISKRLASLPEETREKIQNLVRKIATSIGNEKENSCVKQPVMDLISILTKHEVIKASNSESVSLKVNEQSDMSDNDDEDEDNEQEISGSDVNISIAGSAVTPITSQEITSKNAQPEANINDGRQSRHVSFNRNTRTEARNINVSTTSDNVVNEQSDMSDDTDSIIPGQSVFDNDNSNSNENHKQDNAFDRALENFTNNRNSSRSRNNDRRTAASSNNNNNDISQTTSINSRKTVSHNDFSSFFEGVLNNRRINSQEAPSPLNLRGNINLSQSETLRDGLVNVVRFIRADGVHKANVIIDPPALGRISVELTSGTSGVEATIKVASEQIRQLIQDQLSQLRMNLSQQGVQVAEFTVDVQQDNQQSGQNSQEQNQNQRRTGIIGGVEDEEPEEFRVDLEDGLLYWVA